MKMFEESTLSPRSTLEVIGGQPRSSVSSRRPSRDEAFPGGGLSSLSEARAREDTADGRAPLGRMTSTHSLKTAWKLKYQDFLPEKGNGIPDRGECFSKIVARANEWLQHSPDVQLKSCETLTWMAHDQKRSIDGEQMIQTHLIGENKTTYYIRGLRLWLCPSSSASSGESLAFLDVVPTRTDDIQTLIGKLNKKIQHNCIKGRIFRLETVPVALDRGHIDPTITRWAENSNDDKQHVFVLRVFHLRRENEKTLRSKALSQTGIKDFVPMPIDDSYEGFETLVERCNNWLREQTDVSLINFQSLMVQRGDGPFMEMSRSCHFTIPGCNSPEPLDVFRVLRVAFLKPTRGNSNNGCNSDSNITNTTADDYYPVICPFTYETFVPELLRQRETASSLRERMERMKETFSKVVAFLRISGADVVGAETVTNPIQMYVDSDMLNDDEQKFLFTLRIYLTGHLRPYDGSVRSIKRASVNPQTELGAEDGGARNAPLFLGSVVQRRFKYRWLILALFGFTCMTIIVVVSVIYSNK